jgi:REP element-mobilizing transposase RayT
MANFYKPAPLIRKRSRRKHLYIVHVEKKQVSVLRPEQRSRFLSGPPNAAQNRRRNFRPVPTRAPRSRYLLKNTHQTRLKIVSWTLGPSHVYIQLLWEPPARRVSQSLAGRFLRKLFTGLYLATGRVNGFRRKRLQPKKLFINNNLKEIQL